MSLKRKKYWGNNPKFKMAKATKTVPNRFQLFSDMEDEEASSLENEIIKRNEVKVPPIIVDNSQSFSTVINLLGTSCKYKRISIGTKIIPNTLIDYNEAVKKLNNMAMDFFTHPIKDHKQFKLMLFGLPKLSTDTIKTEFKETFNIELVNIKEVMTARSNKDDALYMLEFNREQITKKEIFKIRYVSGIVVRWRNPNRRSNGPTQCSKCAMYGHGSANCYRPVACIACGGSHDYANCQLNKTLIDGPVIYKCFNCTKRNLKNINHRADDPHCPSRREYLEIRKRVTNVRRPATTHQFNDPVLYTTDDELFNTRYSEVPRFSQKASGKVENKVSYASVVKSNNKPQENENLSNQQILDIYFEAINALEKCTTKYDKLRVLGNMLRHVI